ncbi:TfpX/TfpZ family type IV pilin accessory protein [Neisseria montereyensis]|uniref:Fimbrial protein n=1 Tax=Neisseria montereyensis TaxID=2973938 RepID=A0ABT2FBS1_9NEIS|nr:TfpX/TfpZ family type IV pilin accessory protein [Neisseria montereyensis]MCS4533189.1 fimbrial protein [Neisseria montereyensis]
MSKRIRYFLSHLAVSFILAILTTLLVTQVWYPAPLFKAAGLAKIFFMMLSLDVLIGPLFSLLVYKEGKKTLLFDLTVIIFIQFAAFSYGFYSIAEGRPAWIVFNKDRFELIRINEIDNRNIDKALPEYQTAPWSGPKWVKVMPDSQSIETQNQVLFEEGLSGGMYSIAQSPIFYQPLDIGKENILNKKQPINNLKKFNTATNIDALTVEFPLADTFMPLKSSGKDMVVLLSNKQPEWYRIVDLNPW